MISNIILVVALVTGDSSAVLKQHMEGMTACKRALYSITITTLGARGYCIDTETGKVVTNTEIK